MKKSLGNSFIIDFEISLFWNFDFGIFFDNCISWIEVDDFKVSSGSFFVWIIVIGDFKLVCYYSF